MSNAAIATMLAVVFGTAAMCFLLASLHPTRRKRLIDMMAVGLVGWIIYSNVANRPPAVKPTSFAQAVELQPIKSMAIQSSGRLKSFDSVARTQMRVVAGGHAIAGQEPTFTFLDILFRPEAYQNADVIYVKKKPVRQLIYDHLLRADSAEISVLETFMQTGLLSPDLLNHPLVQNLFGEMEKDLVRTARPVNEIQAALARLRPGVLMNFMRMIPPPGSDKSKPWHMLDELLASAVPGDAIHQGMSRAAGIAGMDAELQSSIGRAWETLEQAWRGQDASAVNAGLARLAALVRTASPGQYPEQERLKLENWYFRWKGMTWIWIVYLASVVPLLMSVIYHWRGARLAGVFLFLTAFALHTSSLGIRWYISGRIPNSNMFEAITASTWLAGVVAFVLEWVVRRTPMRNLFFLGAAVAGMTATMCNNFMPATLSPDIDNIMPVLHDVWLYIHTNVIILSYGLIAMAAVTALLYLRHRIGGGARDYAQVGGAGTLILSGQGGRGFLSDNRVSAGKILDGATMVLMELSFVMLWAGLVMGAIWADHSWGRPWGWDPKEVFALNTFIIFLILVHVRFKVKDRGLWTAVLAVVGCGVMLFNWIVINFVITGLHSYA